MSALFRLSGTGRRDPVIEEWLNKTDALTAIARTWFRKMRACGDDVLEVRIWFAPAAESNMARHAPNFVHMI